MANAVYKQELNPARWYDRKGNRHPTVDDPTSDLPACSPPTGSPSTTPPAG